MDKHLLLALFIPVLFLGATGLIKSLVKRDFFWSNFYLGIDIALAALANGIVNIVDISDKMSKQAAAQGTDFAGKIYNNAIFLLLAVGVLLMVMIIHQRLEIKGEGPIARNHRLKRGIWLGGVANILGGAVLITFILYRLKGLL